MSKNGQMPEVLFLSPVGHSREKRRYKRLTVAVFEWDQYGRPKKFELLHEDADSQKIEDICERGAEFMSVYVMDVAIRPHKDKVRKRLT